MKPGDISSLRFDDIAPKGDAICSAEVTGTKPVFASGVIPGETAKVEIRRERKNWIAVDVLEIEDASPHRVEPRCPLFHSCSGCQLQHVEYEHQLDLKKRMVEIQLEKFGGLTDVLVHRPLGAKNPWYYRNHARFTVRDGRLGYIRRFRKQWFEVDHCYIMDPAINEALAKLQGEVPGATQVNVRSGKDAAEPMVQPKLNLRPELELTSGQPHVYETVADRRFRVSAASFFQVNREQAATLAEVVRQKLEATPDSTIVDAYAGVGTFAVLLSPHVREVIAIEESGPAVDDAKVNIEGIDNIRYVLAKTESVLGELEGQVDGLILDPPRSGCHEGALVAVRKLAPRRLVYVSCDPASLGRDLAALTAGDDGFEIIDVQPIDMFPHTHHIECVATLTPKSLR